MPYILYQHRLASISIFGCSNNGGHQRRRARCAPRWRGGGAKMRRRSEARLSMRRRYRGEFLLRLKSAHFRASIFAFAFCIRRQPMLEAVHSKSARRKSSADARPGGLYASLQEGGDKILGLAKPALTGKRKSEFIYGERRPCL